MDYVTLINKVNLQDIGQVTLIKLLREESMKGTPRDHMGLLQAKRVADVIREAYRLGVIRGQVVNNNLTQPR